MKNKSRWLALMLTGSMMVSPLSYTRTYAAENEQQYETNLQETVEVEEADLDKKQDASQNLLRILTILRILRNRNFRHCRRLLL